METGFFFCFFRKQSTQKIANAYREIFCVPVVSVS